MKSDGTERMNAHGETRWVFEITDSLVDRWLHETLTIIDDEAPLDARALNRLKEAVALLGEANEDADLGMIAGAHIAHGIPMERILVALTKTRLQHVCQIWGWDDSGSKRVLTERVLAQLEWAGYKSPLYESDETEETRDGAGTLTTRTNLRARVHVDAIERVETNDEEGRTTPGYAITLSLSLPEHIAQRVFQDYVQNGTADIEFRPLGRRQVPDYVRV
ncbi:MAG: hypothetical protein KY455_01780 [Euryarchaeota archaeon]|nr:hypothetical protein [Euryarchaeota archaeon]